MQALQHDPAEINGGFGRSLEGDLHDAAFDRGGFVIALDVVAADHVEDHVGAFAGGRGLGHGDEVFGLVIDRDIGAELAAASHLSGEPAVVMTFAPKAFASWIAVVPIPEVPPCTSNVSPLFSAPRSNTLCQTVKNVSGTRGGFRHRKFLRHRQAHGLRALGNIPHNRRR